MLNCLLQKRTSEHGKYSADDSHANTKGEVQLFGNGSRRGNICILNFLYQASIFLPDLWIASRVP